MSNNKSPNQNQNNQATQTQPNQQTGEQGCENAPIVKSEAEVAAEAEVLKLQQERDILLAKLEELKDSKGGESIGIGAEDLELNEDGLMTGNKDEKGEYPFDPSWRKGVVVRHALVDKIGSSNDFAEIPSSVRLAVYDKATFAFLNKNKGFGALQVKVIHQP